MDSDDAQAKEPEKKVTKFKAVMEWLSTARAFLLAATGFLVALGAWFKPQDQVPIQATYQTLKTQVEANNKATEDLHDDITALRGYVDGFRTAMVLPSAAPSSAPVSALHPIKRTDLYSGPVATLMTPIPKTEQNVAPPEPKLQTLPPISSRPKSVPLPPYAQVVGDARKAAD